MLEHFVQNTLGSDGISGIVLLADLDATADVKTITLDEKIWLRYTGKAKGNNNHLLSSRVQGEQSNEAGHLQKEVKEKRHAGIQSKSLDSRHS